MILWHIFPNPCKDYLYLNLKEIKPDKIFFYATNGEMKKSVQVQGDNRISISDINSGIYIIKIFTVKNIYIDKLIKL